MSFLFLSPNAMFKKQKISCEVDKAVANEDEAVANEDSEVDKAVANEDSEVDKTALNEDGKEVANEDGKAVANEDGKAVANEDGKAVANEDGKAVANEDGKALIGVNDTFNSDMVHITLNNLKIRVDTLDKAYDKLIDRIQEWGNKKRKKNIYKVLKV